MSKCEKCGHEFGSVYCIALCPPAAPLPQTSVKSEISHVEGKPKAAPRVAWLHRANDSYYTEEQVNDPKGFCLPRETLETCYYQFIEKSAFDDVVNERDELRWLFDGCAALVMPGECDSSDAYLKLFRRLRADNVRLNRELGEAFVNLSNAKARLEGFEKEYDKLRLQIRKEKP